MGRIDRAKSLDALCHLDESHFCRPNQINQDTGNTVPCQSVCQMELIQCISVFTCNKHQVASVNVEGKKKSSNAMVRKHKTKRENKSLSKILTHFS